MDPDGTKAWYANGKLHRDDGPAVIRPDNTEEWYMHGKPMAPLMPFLASIGVRTPLQPQPDVVAKLSTPEQKKNIMRWLTRAVRSGSNATTAITALRKIGVDWTELKSMAADINASKNK